MKNFFIVILFFFLFFNISGNDITLKFENGNKKFTENDYQEALETYLEIGKSVSNWKLFYNTGCAYFKLNDFVSAKIFFLKADKLKPFNTSIRKNLEITDARLNNSIQIKDDDFVLKFIKRVETIFSINFISLLLLLFVLVLNYFLFVLIKRGRSRFILYGVSFSLILFMFISTYHFYRTGKAQKKEIAVVIKEGAQLRSGPGDNNTVLFNIGPGIKVKIINESVNWIHVSASSDIAGWIKSEAITKI
ncbi:MAG: SH3 domain-containing protein [Acidobacteriota bacterium]